MLTGMSLRASEHQIKHCTLTALSSNKNIHIQMNEASLAAISFDFRKAKQNLTYIYYEFFADAPMPLGSVFIS